MAQAVRAKVQRGLYASESEVLRDGVRVLIERDRAVEQWLLTEVGAAFDALEADPSRALTADEVRTRLSVALNKRG